MQERDESDAEYDHGDRQSEVELNEPQAVGRTLTGGADQGDRRELRSHHRQADRPPRKVAVGQEIALDVLRTARPAQAVEDDEHEIRRDDGPIDPMHEGLQRKESVSRLQQPEQRQGDGLNKQDPPECGAERGRHGPKLLAVRESRCPPPHQCCRAFDRWDQSSLVLSEREPRKAILVQHPDMRQRRCMRVASICEWRGHG